MAGRPLPSAAATSPPSAAVTATDTVSLGTNSPPLPFPPVPFPPLPVPPVASMPPSPVVSSSALSQPPRTRAAESSVNSQRRWPPILNRFVMCIRFSSRFAARFEHSEPHRPNRYSSGKP